MPAKKGTENMTDTISVQLNKSYIVSNDTVIELLNDVLNNEVDLTNLLAQNNVAYIKGKLPGLIVQVSD